MQRNCASINYKNIINIFNLKLIIIYIQGLEGAASFLTNPLRNIFNLITWLFVRTLWIMSQFVNIPETFARVHSDEDLPEKPKPPHEVEITYACDLKRTLYIMNQTMAVNQITNSSEQCSRPFFAQLVSILFCFFFLITLFIMILNLADI